MSIPHTMRAWQWTSSGIPTTLPASIHLNNAATPPSPSSLKPDQSLIRVTHASLNPVDYKAAEAPFVARFLAFRGLTTPTFDFCGEVVATGGSTRDVKKGDRIFGSLQPPFGGALAEYCVVPNGRCAVVPEDVKSADAVSVGIAGATAWQCLDASLPKNGGGKVFINGGSGGTGMFGIQFAKARGAYVVTTCSGRNVELCKKLGADEVIDYTQGDVVQKLIKSVRENGAFDGAVDNVGGATELFWQAHQYLKPGAKVVAVGAEPGLQVMVDLMKIFLWPAALGGGRRRYHFLAAEPNPETFRQIAGLMAEGKVKPVIEEVYEMEEAPRAYERLKTGRTVGKLVVKVAA